jgi:divalent metal cation (Fe/Co/Zn/Cd) transporter
VWLIALGVYYLLLAVMRAVLVGYVHREKIGENIPREFRRYRVCGYVLLVMNQALTGIVIYIVHANQGFSYPGPLIYGMAIYAFYAVITATVNLVKRRKLGSPVLSAAKAVSLTAALVSMLSLETAMLAEFGNDDSVLRFWMTGISGGVVCAFVLAMAIYMIVRSAKNLKQAKFYETETKL